jgi:hypothetical protein
MSAAAWNGADIAEPALASKRMLAFAHGHAHARID